MNNNMIPSLTDDNERFCLSVLASEVPSGGQILEIGTLYGGMTAVLAQSAPSAKITTIDNFSWHPEDMPANNRESVLSSLHALGIKNVTILEGDSREICKRWDSPIDLLWIDGGHSYPFVSSDIFNFGKYAEVIALHDYKNPAWPTIERAVNEFLSVNRKWQIEAVVGMVVVLRKM